MHLEKEETPNKMQKISLLPSLTKKKINFMLPDKNQDDDGTGYETANLTVE